MNRAIEISVVVPLMNVEGFVAGCLQALLSQSYPKDSYEVIVVDNGSQDASRMIAERYPGIKVLVENERGAYTARNRGIAEARGTVIALTDPDCVPEKNWLHNINVAMKEGSVLVVLGRRCFPPLSLKLSLLEAYENVKDEFVFNSRMGRMYYGYTNNMAVRRKLFEELGPFLSIPRGADTIFIRQVVDTYSSDAVCYCPNVEITHLEIKSATVYFQKVFLYGWHRLSSNRITYSEPLSVTQRFKIFRKVIVSRGYSTFQASQLLCLLLVGGIMWYLGRWSRLSFTFLGKPADLRNGFTSNDSRGKS